VDKPTDWALSVHEFAKRYWPVTLRVAGTWDESVGSGILMDFGDLLHLDSDLMRIYFMLCLSLWVIIWDQDLLILQTETKKTPRGQATWLLWHIAAGGLRTTRQALGTN